MAVTEGASDEVKRVQVYAGPTGLVLLLLLFLVLPMVTASCSIPEDNPDGPGEISVSVTGAELLAGGDPGYSASGAFNLSPGANAGMAAEATPSAAGRALGIATVAVMGFGLLTMFVRVWRLRAIVTAVTASVAAVLLVVTEIVLVGRLVLAAEDNAAWLVELPSTQGVDVVGRADEVVSTGWGFWLPLAGLVAIAAVNTFLLVRPALRRSSA